MQPIPQRGRRSAPLALTVALTVAALTSAVHALPAQAAPAQAAPASAATTPLAAASELAQEPTIPVTLVTGETAFLSTTGQQHQVVLRGADGADPGEWFTRRVGDDVYAIPVAALDLIGENRLDLELFNVSALVEQGFDDLSRDTLPLIVSQGTPRSSRSLGLTVGAQLTSLDGAAVTVTKTRAAEALEGLLGSGPDARVSLDALVHPAVVAASPAPSDLDPGTGVAQTGAPEAWAAGWTGKGVKVAVLDSGWDAAHPDLADRVAEARDFTVQGSPADDDGHGTHVAGTIAGDGSLDASRVGMAPEADLLIGRVLGQRGGQTSWIIDGAEWAVASGATVVNMSLGSRTPQPCDDPIADAVDALGDDALFVISAGNLGIREGVSSPGCAEKALTVGAVDSHGAVASFSSRGSVVGDHRVKPDISAPGVDTISAYAGRPGGVGYTRMSGTSMAAPHVAGAAALVAQAHPDWTPQQLKRALTAGVKADEESTIYEEGSGELWVPGALDATVTSDVSVSLGTLDWPHAEGERESRTVTYTNSDDAPVTLDLTVARPEGADGRSLPANLVTVSPRRITVPAGGSTDVTVTALDRVGQLSASSYGEVSARVLAQERRAGGDPASSTTAVGMWLAPETRDVTFRAVDRNGRSATVGLLDVIDRHAPSRSVHVLDGADVTMQLRAGTYAAGAFIRTEVAGKPTWSYVAIPDLAVGSRTSEVVLDARTAQKVEVTTPDPISVVSSQMGWHLTWDRWVVGNSIATGRADLFVAPTDRVTGSEFGFATMVRGIEPGAAPGTSDYVYNLAFVESGRIGKDQSRTVTRDGLAVVRERWHSELTDSVLGEWLSATPAGWSMPVVGAPLSVAAPTERTAYYSPDLAWQQRASLEASTPQALWVDPTRTYRAGQQVERDWLRLRSRTGTAYGSDGSPARIAERQGTLIGFSFPHWQDTEPGRYAVPGLGEVGNTALWVDGVLRGSRAYPNFQADIGTGSHDIRTRIIQTKLPRFGAARLSSTSITYHSFRSAQPEGDAVAALPVVMPRYDAPVDERNTAPRHTAFPVTIGVVGQQGFEPGTWSDLRVRMTSEKLTWSADGLPEDSDVWIDVPVERRGDTWVALVDQSAAPVGSTISIAVEGSAGGGQVEQYLLDLYAIR